MITLYVKPIAVGSGADAMKLLNLVGRLATSHLLAFAGDQAETSDFLRATRPRRDQAALDAALLTFRAKGPQIAPSFEVPPA